MSPFRPMSGVGGGVSHIPTGRSQETGPKRPACLAFHLQAAPFTIAQDLGSLLLKEKALSL